MPAKCKLCKQEIDQHFQLQIKLSRQKIKSQITNEDNRKKFMLSLIDISNNFKGHFDINLDVNSDIVTLDVQLLCDKHYHEFKKALTKTVHKAVNNDEIAFTELMTNDVQKNNAIIQVPAIIEKLKYLH
jgi:hypothetical protein